MITAVNLGPFGRHVWDYRLGDLSVEVIRVRVLLFKCMYCASEAFSNLLRAVITCQRYYIRAIHMARQAVSVLTYSRDLWPTSLVEVSRLFWQLCDRSVLSIDCRCGSRTVCAKWRDSS